MTKLVSLRFAVLTLILGLTAPFAVQAVRQSRQDKVLALAAYAVDHSGFTGVTVVQMEYLNCKFPLDKANVKQAAVKTRALSPDGSRVDITRQVDSDESHAVIRLPKSYSQTYPHVNSRLTLHKDSVNPDHLKAVMRDPKSDCLTTYGGDVFEGEAKIGEEEILGYLTVKTQRAIDGRIRTVWLAPTLGCFELQMLTEYADDPKQPGVVIQNSFITPTRVMRGRPEQSLFYPQGLVERKPSDINIEIIARRIRMTGVGEAEAYVMAKKNLRESAYRLDKMYSSRQ